MNTFNLKKYALKIVSENSGGLLEYFLDEALRFGFMQKHISENPSDEDLERALHTMNGCVKAQMGASLNVDDPTLREELKGLLRDRIIEKAKREKLSAEPEEAVVEL